MSELVPFDPNLQFDPALQELLLRRTGNLRGEFLSEDVAAQEIPVVVRLRDAARPVEWLTMVTRFGPIATGRVRLDKIIEVRQHENVASLKASQDYRPALVFSVPEIRASSETLRQQIAPDGVTGKGVVVGVMDWGCDFAHVNFRNEDGSTRLLYLWDQRGGVRADSPEPFRYGREFTREQINAALSAPDPYAALGYDPAWSDPNGAGTHGTHVLDIAAGNGSAPGASPGVAPEADLIFVHLRGDDTGPQDTLGDSARVLEAVHYIVARAGNRPVVINLSLGRTGGPHDGETLVERGLDALLDEAPGLAVVMSTGNYFDADLHSSGQVGAGERADLPWRSAPRNDEIAEMEIWYPGADAFAVELIDPNGRSLARVQLGESSVIREDDRIIASIYHRRRDPNNGDNQIDIFLWPDAMIGTWVTRLHGEAVVDGSYHAWIERDDPEFQSRFAPEVANKQYTTGSICNGRKTIAVGAYDAREAGHAPVPFTSSGPARDGRLKPDISAPGAGIRAARSSKPLNGYRAMNGLTIKSGTSMAAPHVTGVVALMFEAAGEQRLSAEQTRMILTDTARTSPPGNEEDRLRYGAGRVDAAAAVKAVRSLMQTGTGLKEVSDAEDIPALYTITESCESDTIAILDGETDTDQFSLMNPIDPEEILSDAIRLAEDDSEESDNLNVHHFDTIDEDDPANFERLGEILPRLLVEFGDRELHHVDEYGVPVYDKSQPLYFALAERQYALTD